jgi:glutamate/tyrosine decarboxylase-like PLP-dependent enzyme
MKSLAEGATVRPGKRKETGGYPVRLSQARSRDTLFSSVDSVCFRYVGVRLDSELNQAKQAILRRVYQRGRAYLSNAMLHANFWLRACVVNNRTTDSDIEEVVSEVLKAAREVS